MSEHKPSLTLGTTWRMTHLIISLIFNHQMARCCDYYTHLFHLLGLFSVIKGLALPWTCWICEALIRLFVESVFKMNINFCCHFCCSTATIYRHNPLQCTAIPFTWFGFRPPFLLADDVLPWFVYVTITLEIAALDTPNKVTVSLQMPQLNTPTICPLWKSETSPILEYLQTNCYWTQSVINWHWHYTAQTKRIRKIQLPFFQCSQHKHYSYTA